SGEYLPGSLQGKISSDGCLKKEQMVVSAIASTPQRVLSRYCVIYNLNQGGAGMLSGIFSRA
ncbi:hypothetical protein, partial [Escherichia coli]